MVRVKTGVRTLFISTAFFLSACSPLSLLNSTVDHNGYSSILNQAYGKQTRQQLDIHLPKKVKPGADVVIFYYGGRWQYGNKEEYTFVADAFTSKGFITVLPDYRVYPEVDWQAFVKDGADAYQWVYDNIAQYKGNPERIFISGHSAGAHIAAMVAVDDALLDSGVKRPCGFIGLAGPYDFLPIEQADIQRVFSSAKDLQLTQPITYVSKDDPAMLLLHGLDDTTVKPGNSIRMLAKSRLVGGVAEYRAYDHADHVDILISLSSTFRDYSSALSDSIEFIKQTDCL